MLENDYYIYKKDNCYYNSIRMIIYKHKEEEEFILKVENIKNSTESYYEISQSDFDNDSEEVDLKEYYEFDCRNQINWINFSKPPNKKIVYIFSFCKFCIFINVRHNEA